MTDDEYAALAARNERYSFGADCHDPTTVEALLDAEYPDLTATQRVGILGELANVPAVMLRDKGWVRWHIDEVAKSNPKLFVKVPSPADLFRALGGDDKHPAERIKLLRSLEALTEDERLARMPKSTEAAPAEPKAQEPKPTAVKAPLADDDACDDALAQRFGYRDRHDFRANTWASKVTVLRREVRKQTTPITRSPVTPQPTEGPLHPAERIRRHRAAGGR